jgi:toxin-antitoxin system PIN domain toxin
VSDLILSAFIRVVSHPGVFGVPTPIDEALEAADRLRQRPNGVPIAPGPHQWDIFARLCRVAGVKGALVPDAYPAALAIESGSESITSDRDFARFPGLRWRHPLEKG